MAPPNEMLGLLDEWERFLHDRTPPPRIHIALAHQRFESIHPFLDGNCRVGRLLITLLWVERGVLPSPLLYLRTYFEATRTDDYEQLQGARSNEAKEASAGWHDWVLYFLRGVTRQSEDAIGRVERINGLLARRRTQTASSRTRAVPAWVVLLAENPYWTVKHAATRLDVAFTTAQRAIDRLVAAGIMERIGDAKRDRLFCASEILAIIEEPVVLAREMRPGE